MKKGFLISTILILLGLLLYFLQIEKKDDRPRIALCPTFHSIADIIEKSGFEVFKTVSTSESLFLIEQDLADFVLSGRKLMPHEPSLEYRIMGNGYSFLGREEIVITEKNAKYFKFYTDFEKERLESDFPFITQIEEVDDIYEYLETGILITSWDRTNYKKASPIHIMKKDGSRNKLSRIPTLYCSRICEKEKTDKIEKVVSLFY